MFETTKHCFCAFCRSERFVYRKRHISAGDAGIAAFASLLLSFICWQEFDPRAAVFFAFGLGFAEIFIQVRWRLSIACPHCGFDPVLYKKSPEKTAVLVKEFLALREQNPISVLAPLHLTKVRKPRA